MKNLANKVVKKLIKKKLKVSFAESCTGGLLSSSITSISGSSKVFNLGLITYSNKTKVDILKIPNKIIKKYGAVSEECCHSMLVNLEKISRAKINLAITGIAGPKGGTKKKPVGLVFIGIKKGKRIKINKYLFVGIKRESVRKNSVKKSLDLIKKFI